MAPKSSLKNVESAAPPQSNGSALRTLILVLLPLLSIVGAYTTLILGNSNGTFDIIKDVVALQGSLLPGSVDPILRTYTGIQALDAQLAVLVTFFAPVSDRSHADLALSGGFGLGQFGGAWALLMLESIRLGNKGKIVNYLVIFGLIVQNITFAVTIPIYLFIHLLTSPVASSFPGKYASSVLRVSPMDLAILPFSIILGYIVPSVLMALPAPLVVSGNLHQQFIALWQPFPLWTALIQGTLKFICTLFSSDSSKPAGGKADSLGAAYLKAAKYPYVFVLIFCAMTHLPVLALSALPPSFFENAPAEIIRLSQSDLYGVYVPYPPVFGLKFGSLAEGVQNFLVWDLYVGMTSILLWAILMYRNATSATATWLSLPALVIKILIWGLVAGPMGAAAILLWERDAIVGEKTKQGV